MKLLFTTVAAFAAFLLPAPAATAQWTPTAIGMIPAGHMTWLLDAVDGDVVWALSSDYQVISSSGSPPFDHQPVLLRTVDGGDNWTTQEPPVLLASLPVAMVAVSANEVHINAWHNGIWKLFHTMDGGATWQTRLPTQMVNSTGYILARFTAQDWFAHMGYDPGAGATSSDGGASWQAVAGFPALIGNEYLANWIKSALHGDRLWLVTRNNAAGRIIRTTDRGMTWSSMNSPLSSRMLHAIAFHDELNGMIGSCWTTAGNVTTPMIAVTSDGGDTWQTLSSSPPGYFYELAAVPGVPGAYVTGDSDPDPLVTPASYITLDNGLTWSTIDQGTYYYRVEFTAPDKGWAGWAIPSVDDTTPAIFKWTGGHVGMRSVGNGAASVKVFPNPTDGRNVRVVVPVEWDRVSIIVRDASSRVVAQGTEQRAQADGLPLPVEQLAPGVYHIEARSGERQAHAKLVVE